MKLAILSALGYGLYKVVSKCLPGNDASKYTWNDLQEIVLKKDFSKPELDRLVHLAEQTPVLTPDMTDEEIMQHPLVFFWITTVESAQWHQSSKGNHPANAAARNLVMMVEDQRIIQELYRIAGEQQGSRFAQFYNERLAK